MIYSRTDANKRIEELKIESTKIIEEFKTYFNTAKSIEIKYEAILTPMGWAIDSYLLFGNSVIKKYNVPELANLELNEMMLNRILQLRQNMYK